MNKSVFLKLLTVYLGILGAVLIITLSISILTGGGFRGNGMPLFVSPLITLGVALILLGIFVCIGIGIAVHQDARRRGMEPLLWALVAALVPYFVGLIAYLIVRQPIQPFCSSCGGAIVGGGSYCAACGHSLKAPCSSCGRPTEPGDVFCPHCGSRLGSD